MVVEIILGIRAWIIISKEAHTIISNQTSWWTIIINSMVMLMLIIGGLMEVQGLRINTTFATCATMSTWEDWMRMNKTSWESLKQSSERKKASSKVQLNQLKSHQIKLFLSLVLIIVTRRSLCHQVSNFFLSKNCSSLLTKSTSQIVIFCTRKWESTLWRRGIRRFENSKRRSSVEFGTRRYSMTAGSKWLTRG